MMINHNFKVFWIEKLHQNVSLLIPLNFEATKIKCFTVGTMSWHLLNIFLCRLDGLKY